MFTTWTGGLFARTGSSSAAEHHAAGSLVGTPHRFRIDWTATGTTYPVDGTVVATHAVPSTCRCGRSSVTWWRTSVAVDWMRMSPYAPAGTFLSRVFDGAPR